MGSRPGRCRWPVSVPRGDRCRGSDGAVEQAVEDVEARQQLERALLESRLNVAGGRVGASPARSRRRRAAGSSCERPRRRRPPARRRRRRRASRTSSASTMPMSGIRSMNDPLKRSACHARDESRADPGERRPRVCHGLASSRSSVAAPDRDGAEQEPVAGQPRVQSAARRRRAPRSGSSRRRVRPRRRSRRCR